MIVGFDSKDAVFAFHITLFLGASVVVTGIVKILFRQYSTDKELNLINSVKYNGGVGQISIAPSAPMSA
jgi:hypothetical protein